MHQQRSKQQFSMSQIRALCTSVVFHLSFVVACFAQNINVSNGIVFDGEPNLAVNPNNSQNLVIAWMSYSLVARQISLRTKASFDGGKTWGVMNLQPHASPTQHSADPTMVWHKDGMLSLCYVDYRERPDSGGIFLSQSTNGGVTWSPPKKFIDIHETSDEPIDRPWLAVDNSGGASDGTIYITSIAPKWNPLPNQAYLKISSDRGASWSELRLIEGSQYPVGSYLVSPMPYPTVASDGTLYIVYPSYDPTKNIYPWYVLATSKDKGATFEYHRIVSPKPLGHDTLSKLGAHLEVNPIDGRHLNFTWIDNRFGDTDILSIHSNDGGQTWGNPLRVNDDPMGNGVWQDLQWQCYSAKGDLVIVWRDRRNGTGVGYEAASDIYFSVSHDDGKSFGKNVRLSDMTVPFHSILNQSGNDFLGAVFANDTLCVAWGDVRTGSLNIFFTRAALSSPTAIERDEAKRDFHFIVHPNPARSQFSVDVESAAGAGITLYVFDLLGRKIQTIFEGAIDRGNRSFDCVTASLPRSGLYFVRLQSRTSSLFKPLHVMK